MWTTNEPKPISVYRWARCEQQFDVLVWHRIASRLVIRYTDAAAKHRAHRDQHNYRLFFGFSIFCGLFFSFDVFGRIHCRAHSSHPFRRWYRRSTLPSEVRTHHIGRISWDISNEHSLRLSHRFVPHFLLINIFRQWCSAIIRRLRNSANTPRDIIRSRHLFAEKNTIPNKNSREIDTRNESIWNHKANLWIYGARHKSGVLPCPLSHSSVHHFLWSHI